MSVTPKPFRTYESIVRSIFKGRPSVFAAEDVNRQFDAIDYALRRSDSAIGLIRSNFNVKLYSGNTIVNSLPNPTVPNGRDEYEVVVKISIDKVADDRAFVYARGCEIEVQEQTIQQTHAFRDPFAIGVALYLIAKRHTVTYAENPVMSGLNSTEHPESLPSSDTVVYKDARWALVGGETGGWGLTGEEEVIGIVWSLSQAITHNSYGVKTEFLQPKAHATTFVDILQSMPFNDLFNDEMVNFSHNYSLTDIILQYKKVNDQRFEFLESLAYAVELYPYTAVGTTLNSLFALDTAFANKPFHHATVSKITYRRQMHRIDVDFDILCDFLPNQNTSPDVFYIEIPGIPVARTGCSFSGQMQIEASVSIGGSDYTIRTVATIRAVGGTGYLEVRPFIHIKTTQAGEAFQTPPVYWLGAGNGTGDDSLTMHGQISFDYN